MYIFIYSAYLTFLKVSAFVEKKINLIMYLMKIQIDSIFHYMVRIRCHVSLWFFDLIHTCYRQVSQGLNKIVLIK